MSLHVVATYYRDQAYGGPEEGGWWYSTYELDDAIAAFQDEDDAWEFAREYNDKLDPHEQPRATVVELGRWELLPEYRREACHGDIDDLYDEEGNILPGYRVQRWDLPTDTPEYRPHYC